MKLSRVKGRHAHMTSEIVPTISSDPYSSAKVRLPTVTEAVISVAPWPFATETVELACEGRRIGDPVSGDEALRAALASAPWVTLHFTLQCGIE